MDQWQLWQHYPFINLIKIQLQVWDLQFQQFIQMVFRGQPVKTQPIEQCKSSHLFVTGPFKIDRQGDLQKPLFQPYNSQWSVSQIAKYAAFALQNKKQMEQSPQLVLWGLYKQMSSFIGTRNFRQCKNYHCRLMKQWKKINGIIEHYKSTLDNFCQQFRKQRQNVKNYYEKKELQAPRSQLKQNMGKNQSITSANYQTITPQTNIKEYLNPLRIQINQLTIKEPIFMSSTSNSKKSINEQWIQCHQLFLQWTQRLKELNQMNMNF